MAAVQRSKLQTSLSQNSGLQYNNSLSETACPRSSYSADALLTYQPTSRATKCATTIVCSVNLNSLLSADAEVSTGYKQARQANWLANHLTVRIFSIREADILVAQSRRTQWSAAYLIKRETEHRNVRKVNKVLTSLIPSRDSRNKTYGECQLRS